MVLSEVLSKTLDQHSSQLVMDNWNEKCDEVAKLMVSDNDSGKSKRGKKDPNAPKKWNTSYILFCMDQREKIKNTNKNLNAVQITSKLGELWKALPDKERKHYEELSKKDKTRYEEEMEKYNPKSSEEKSFMKKSRNKQTGPKRPLTAYMYFCKEKRPEVKAQNPELSGTEITTRLGTIWKSFSLKDKAPYETLQQTDKNRYEIEKNSLSEKKVETDKQVANNNKQEKVEKVESKVETTKQVANNNKQEKVETNKKVATKKQEQKSDKKKENSLEKTLGYSFFVKDQTDEIETENPEWNSKKVLAEVNKRWKELSLDDKEAYENEALALAEEEAELELDDE